MNAHRDAVAAVKTISEYCNGRETCGKCVLFPVCSEGLNFTKQQINDAEAICRRLEKEAMRGILK